MKTPAIFISLLLGAGAIFPCKVFGNEVSPSEYIKNQEPPKLASEHRLLPLSLAPGWEPSMDFETRKELADRWGFGLFFGRLSDKSVDQALNDPESVYYQVLQLAKSDPKRYPLDVFINTQSYHRKVQPGTEDLDGDGIIDDGFLRDKDGELVNGKKTPSPETPDALWDEIVENLTRPLKRLAAEGVEFNVIQHWSEWFFPVFGWGKDAYQSDPRVVAAMEKMAAEPHEERPHYADWNRYLHSRRGHYEKILADAVKEIAPNRNSYNWYVSDGGIHYLRYGGYASWTYFDFEQAKEISDYPGASLYRPDNGVIINSGKNPSQVDDLLTRALSAKGVEIAHGVPLNQSWLWVRQNNFRIFEQYIGFTKCLYVLGMVGHLQFLFPEGAHEKTNFNYSIPFDPAAPPTWIQQTLELAKVYSTFTHLDDFIFEGELIEGPFQHIYPGQKELEKPLAGYVLDNPYELFRQTVKGRLEPTPNGEVRVVGRHKPDGELLLCVWAADGEAREGVPVTLPDGQEVALDATPQGTLYRGMPDKLVKLE